MEKIGCILLVDDDPTTNFLNEELIAESEVAVQTHVVWNGQEALDYINLEGKYKNKRREKYALPNLIFLDINMPLMDGFEFLEEYNKLPKAMKAEVVVIFLTTSDAQKDRLQSNIHDLVYDFLEKPLRRNVLLKIKEQYFSTHMNEK